MNKAIGIIELTSISKGIYSADQMIKVAPVEIISLTPICPGKYIAILSGEVSAVKESIDLGEKISGEFLTDSFILPNVHQDIFPAITSTTMPEKISALGIIECFSVSTMVFVADAILKAANVSAIELRLGTGLGGKAYFTFTGDVASVEAGLSVGKEISVERGMLVNMEIIPSPSEKIWESLF